MRALAARYLMGAGVMFLGTVPVQARILTVKQETFASVDEAVKALRAVVATGDTRKVAALFGPQYSALLSGDVARDAAQLKGFYRSLSRKLELSPLGSGKLVLDVGKRGWPFPIPLAEKGGRWFFDTAAGLREVADRRIGKDELDAIALCRAYAKGLVTPSDILGRPRRGYRFKIVAGPGGVKSSGAVLIAYPEQWGRSGIMTFAVGRDGVVYKKSFREKTPQAVAAMRRFNPAKTWAIERDPGTIIRAEAKPSRRPRPR
jgi:hypothetical protein